MSKAVIGLLAGLLLAIAASFGFGEFLLAVVFGAVGLAIGAQLDGTLDLKAVMPGRGRG